MGDGVTITDVTMVGCKDSPCDVKVGSNVTGEIQFQTKTPIAGDLTCKVTGVINGVSMPFPGSPVCNQKSKSDDGKVVYAISISVPKMAPKVRGSGVQKNSEYHTNLNCKRPMYFD